MREAHPPHRSVPAQNNSVRPARMSKKNSHEATHGQGEADPSATSRVANPASRSDAGLGGWDRRACANLRRACHWTTLQQILAEDTLVRALCPGTLRAGLLQAAWRTALCAWRWRKAGSSCRASKFCFLKKKTQKAVCGSWGPVTCVC